MWSPAVAVIWESWRLTRRRTLLVLTLVTLCVGLLSKSAANPPLAFATLFIVSIGMGMSAPLFGTGAGFPLSKAFARPIRTSVLVGAPLAYVFSVAAASWLVPAAVMRLLTGAPFPLIPVASVIGALAVLVAASTWVTRSTMLRTVLAFAAFIAASAMFRFLDPFQNTTHFYTRKDLSPDVFVLSGTDYLALGLFVLVLYVGITLLVEWQRHGDEELSFPRSSAGASSKGRSGDILEWIRNTCVTVFRWRCPVSSPTAAEIWFELQYYGIPVLVIGALLALCIPLLVQWGKSTQSAIPIVLAGCTFAAPFLAGVSASIWNRRNSSRAEVSAFEAARPISTGQLIGLQVLITSSCIAAAWILMLTSLWLSFGSTRELTIAVIRDAIVSFVLLATLLAFLAALRALVSSYGWRIWMSAVALALYTIAVAVALSREWVDEAVIGIHLWALAVAMPIGTLVIVSKAVAGAAISRRQLGIAALLWVPFAALFVYTLRAAGVADASPAIAALAFTSTVLPLAAVGLAPWSLSRIRHA